MIISAIVLLILSPICFVLLRILFFAVNYFVHRYYIFYLNPTMPRLNDPMSLLSGYLFNNYRQSNI
jgi:hypothetical protein